MYKNVMWATDGSEAADRALAHAKALVAEGGGKLTVVYCEEFTLPGKGGGSLPIYANEEEIEAKIDDRSPSSPITEREPRWSGRVARSAGPRTRSPSLR